MVRRSPFRLLASLKTTVALLVILSALLLLNVVLPQENLVGQEEFQSRMERSGPVYRFLVDTLGLGRLSVSPVFLGTLVLFFLNLTVVIGGRIGPTLRRIQVKPRKEPGLRAWTGMKESLSAPLPRDWSVEHAVTTLTGFGYRVRRAGARTVWGVRHRTAPLGFLAFHLSFFLICAGGALLYYSRFVGNVVLIEGQEFSGEYQHVARVPPLVPPPELRFSLKQVTPVYEDGQPLQLGATFVFSGQGAGVERESWINRPAVSGSAKLLVHRAGLAPVFWLQDEEGFTLDRVSVVTATLGREPTRAPIGGGAVTLEVLPLEAGSDMPALESLRESGLQLRVLADDDALFEGTLRPGEAASWEGGRLVLEEVRYWVAFQVIAERGGGVLIAGFVLGIAGLIWRLLCYRREVALSWDDEELRLTGRGEYFNQRFLDELESIREFLAAGPEQRKQQS